MKVFSVAKFKNDCIKEGFDYQYSIDAWARKLEGLTEKQINKLGYGTEDDWMIEQGEGKMKVYKLEVLIIDYDINSIDEALSIINETRYDNHTNVEAITCREAGIGEWSDDNPLNYTDKVEKEMNRLFPKE